MFSEPPSSANPLYPPGLFFSFFCLFFLWNILILRGNFWSPLNNSVYSPAGELSSKSREISPRAFLSDLSFWVFLNVVVGTFASSRLFNRAQNYFCAQASKEMSITISVTQVSGPFLLLFCNRFLKSSASHPMERSMAGSYMDWKEIFFCSSIVDMSWDLISRLKGIIE